MFNTDLQVDVQSNWLDYATGAISAFVALFTLAAVLVALAPLLRARRRVPRVTIGSRGEDSVSPGGVGHVYLDVGNESGKDMALDVEIAVRVQTTRASRYGVTVLTAHPADFFREPEVSLLLPDPSSDSGVSLRSHLAPGQARQVHLCEYEPEGDGKHVTLRFGSSRTPVHVEIGPLDCVLKLTGRNFDASEFTGRLVFSWNENGDEPFFVAAFGGFREL